MPNGENGKNFVDISKGLVPVGLVIGALFVVWSAGGQWAERGQRVRLLEEWKKDAEIRIQILETFKKAMEIGNRIDPKILSPPSPNGPAYITDRKVKVNHDDSGTVKKTALLRDASGMGYDLWRRIRGFVGRGTASDERSSGQSD